ncbi:hypothetical protein SESI111939_11410 [Serratia silvae]
MGPENPITLFKGLDVASACPGCSGSNHRFLRHYGLVLVVTRDGWLSLFMAVAVVPELILCIVMQPAWLVLAGKPLMLVVKKPPPHED